MIALNLKNISARLLVNGIFMKLDLNMKARGAKNQRGVIVSRNPDGCLRIHGTIANTKMYVILLMNLMKKRSRKFVSTRENVLVVNPGVSAGRIIIAPGRRVTTIIKNKIIAGRTITVNNPVL
jgi:hypothetical protein